MASDGVVLGIVGSPNREGRTFQQVSAALAGAEKAGAQVELVQMADHVVDACKDCVPRDCEKNLKCTYDDPGFEYLSAKIRACGALVLGTPVYWWDTTGMVQYLTLKMFRCFAKNAPLNGLPALGIGVAGGTGNGLVQGVRPVYHFFQMLQMRALPPFPVTRFNFEAALVQAEGMGRELARRAREPQPFGSVEERVYWYDSLPYLGLSRLEERRLLASLAVTAAGERLDPAVVRDLMRCDAIGAAGEKLAAAEGVTAVYNAAVKAFEGR